MKLLAVLAGFALAALYTLTGGLVFLACIVLVALCFLPAGDDE